MGCNDVQIHGTVKNISDFPFLLSQDKLLICKYLKSNICGLIF